MYEFNSDDLIALRALVSSQIAATKNHIASAVEAGADEYGTTNQSGFDYAAALVVKLREQEALYAKCNRILGKMTDGRLGVK